MIDETAPSIRRESGGDGRGRHHGGPGASPPAAPEASGAALDLLVTELEPLAASLLAVGADGSIHPCDARAPNLVAEQCREIANWHRQLRGREPLAPEAIAALERPVATFSDVGGARSLLFGNGSLLSIYRRIGAIDDARLLIRDGGRLVATIALWRPLQSAPWNAAQRRRLELLQPLVEMAFLATCRPRLDRPPLAPLLAARLTPRQREVAALLAVGASNREVARALRISGNTAKSHARAVLAKLGARSRRELMLALRTPLPVP